MPQRPIPGVPILTTRPVKVGRLAYREGETVEVDPATARKLVSLRKARLLDGGAGLPSRAIDTRRHAGNTEPPRPPANAGTRKRRAGTGTDEPGTDEPGTDEPGTGTDEPGTGEG